MPAELSEVVIGQRLAQDLGQGAQHRPILPCLARREDGPQAELGAAFRVHVGAVLLGIGGPGQDDIGAVGAGVAVMALIDDEGLAQLRHVDLVDAEQVDEFDLALGSAGQDARGIAPARPRHEAELEPADPRRGGMEDVEAVPAFLHQPGRLGQLAGEMEHGGAVGACQRALAQDQHRALGLLQNLEEGMAALGQRLQRLRPLAQMLVFIGQVELLADDGHLEAALMAALQDPGVHERGFPARIAADDQAGIGLLDAGDGGVEEIAGPVARIERGAILAAVDIGRAEGGHEPLEGEHRLGIDEVARQGRDLAARDRGQAIGHGLEGLLPGRRLQPPVVPDIGPVEALADQPVAGEARLVGDPLLVHRLVEARQHAHHFAPAGIDIDVAADGVEDVDGFGAVQLPGPGHEGVGLGGQRADRAEVDDVGRKLGAQCPLDIGADLHMLAAAERPQLLHPRHFRREAHAARAMDAAVHRGLDQGAEVLVAHRPLGLGEAAMVHAVGHRLILQIAFPALVADRAVQRMVGEQEFHHPFAGLAHHRGVGVDDHAFGGRHGAGGDGLRRLLLLHQAHAAIAGDRETLVIAEAGNLLARQLAGL